MPDLYSLPHLHGFSYTMVSIYGIRHKYEVGELLIDHEQAAELIRVLVVFLKQLFIGDKSSLDELFHERGRVVPFVFGLSCFYQHLPDGLFGLTHRENRIFGEFLPAYGIGCFSEALCCFHKVSGYFAQIFRI